MALNRSVSAISERLLRSTKKKRRKSQNEQSQYSQLETRQLLAAMPLVNEFVASNSDSLLDDNGNSTDWIELFNAGTDAVDLAGYTLTDDPTNPSKFVLPSVTLGGSTTPGDSQYLVVFAGDDLDPNSGTDIYTGFGLSSSGEYLGFYDPAGNLINEFAAGGGDYPEQVSDVSYGLLNDGTFSEERYFATPTPNAVNDGNTFLGVVADTTASVERGFYDEAFSVDLRSPTLGAILVYTTDGTEPSLNNGVQVFPTVDNLFAETTLTVSTTTSLRAAAFRSGFLTQGATTNTYVFLDDTIASDLNSEITEDPRYENLVRDALLDIPTLSFNYENVIEGRETPEQRASIEWLAPDGSEGFQIDAGINAFGGQNTNFAKKSFRLHFRSEYGDSRLDFPIFEGIDDGNNVPATDSFDQLEFRSGSHDMAQRGFYLSNRFVDDTILDSGHVSPHGRFVHIYINGTYWGQYHMRERWNADFLASYYGGEEEDFTAVNGNRNNGNPTPFSWDPGQLIDGDLTVWNQIQALADTFDTGNPTGGFQELQQLVNMEQYIDFMLIYMAGASESEYRAGGATDGSEGYIFYLNDADGWLRDPLGVGNLRQGGDKTDNPGPLNILGTLVEQADPEFMTFYADRIQKMFFGDGPLTVENSVNRLQERIDEIELSIITESARWGYRTPASFESAADVALETRLPSLTQSMIDRLRAQGVFPNFDAPEHLVDGIVQSGGEVAENAALTFDAPDTVYFTVDGSDPRLVGGEINPNAISYNSGLTTTTLFEFGSTWKYEDSGDNLGNAWRASSYDDSSWASDVGQFGYGGNGENTPIDFGPDPNDKHITTYFRQTFDVATGGEATLNVLRDDGVVVYLNGVEIGRDNLTGPVGFDTLADSAISNSNEPIPVPFTFNLQPGSNTLAVEIHQHGAGSSDLSFDAELVVSTETSGSEPYALTRSTNVKSRTFSNGQWSGLNDATFAIPVTQSELRISELHYNPADPSASEIAAGFNDNDDFEFIEIYNPSITGTINLNGVQLSDGVTFAFGNTDLLPGERVVVVEDVDAFMERYGNSATVLGQWSGALNNDGEEVTLIDSSLDEIMSVNYGDNDPWYNSTNGHGFSLVLEDPANTPIDELGKYNSWRSSTLLGGTPGEASLDRAGVVVNEVLAHTDATLSDSIELFNPTSNEISVGGWYLSDEGDDLFKYQIPAGTVIAAGGYLVFDESDFNVSSTGFALSGSEGDQVYLSQDLAGTFVALQDAVEFDATFNGESLGRLPNGTGRLTRLAETSFGSANGDAKVGPLIISEINYHPADPIAAALALDSTITDNDLEYIEIANSSSADVDLTNWRIRGEADFDFVGGTLAAGEAIVVVSFDPAVDAAKLNAFRAQYGISTGVTIVGGLSATLSNSTGRIALQQPDTPDALGVIPNVVVDEVVYDDLLPWPDADGSGQSLERDDLGASGSFASSWIAATPTPGAFEATVFLLGDANLNGVVNFLDISPFISLLSSGTFLDQADVNRDGLVNFLDISPFISILSSQ